MDYWSSCADIRFFFQDKNKSSASNLSSELYLVLVASKQGKQKKPFLKISTTSTMNFSLVT